MLSTSVNSPSTQVMHSREEEGGERAPLHPLRGGFRSRAGSSGQRSSAPHHAADPCLPYSATLVPCWATGLGQRGAEAFNTCPVHVWYQLRGSKARRCKDSRARIEPGCLSIHVDFMELPRQVVRTDQLHPNPGFVLKKHSAAHRAASQPTSQHKRLSFLQLPASKRILLPK